MTRYRATVALAVDILVDADSTVDAVNSAVNVLMARPGMRSDQVSSVHVVPFIIGQTQASLREVNIAFWQESEAVRHGTPRQYQLWELGALPDQQITDIAREVLFAPFVRFPRRVRMGASSVHRDRSCDGAISWSSQACPLAGLASWELEPLRGLIEAAGSASEHPWLAVGGHNFLVQPRQHTGSCERCPRQAIDVSAMVSVQWAGRTISREYAL